MTDSLTISVKPLLSPVAHTTNIVLPSPHPFSFSGLGLDLDHPVAACVTTGYKDDGEKLSIRCVVFIEKNSTEEPFVSTCGTGIVGSGFEQTLFLNIDYLCKDPHSPEFFAWIVEVYIDKPLVNFDSIYTIVTNIDPKTSRGTRTMVPRVEVPASEDQDS